MEICGKPFGHWTCCRPNNHPGFHEFRRRCDYINGGFQCELHAEHHGDHRITVNSNFHFNPVGDATPNVGTFPSDPRCEEFSKRYERLINSSPEAVDLLIKSNTVVNKTGRKIEAGEFCIMDGKGDIIDTGEGKITKPSWAEDYGQKPTQPAQTRDEIVDLATKIILELNREVAAHTRRICHLLNEIR